MDEILIALALAAAAAGQPAKPAVPSPDPAPMVIPQPPPKPKVSEYDQAQADAVAQGKSLAIFVGCDVRDVPGWLTVQVDDLAGVKAPAILTAKIRNGQLYWHETLAAAASVERIRGEVQASPSPFVVRPKSSRERRIADDDGKGHGPWPAQFAFPVGFEKYTPASYSQSIFTLNNAPAIRPVPRTELIQKWHQAGGLEGVNKALWRSDVYRKMPSEPDVFQARMPVKNSLGFIQHELGWTRKYHDGTQFMDVLTNRETGEVFEIRLRTKQDGKWVSEVDYRNRAHRPLGYRSVSVSDCNSCHSEAGTGNYGVGLVPGGDTVLSDPFHALEK